MGRSVSYPSNAVVTFERFDTDQDTDFQWEVIEPFQGRLKELWSSVDEDDRWLGREDHVVASNHHAFFGVSEYGGLVSYWVVPREWDGYGSDTTALSERWVASIAERFKREFGTLRKVGSFSNGGGIYATREDLTPPADNIDDTAGPIVINGLLTDG